MVFLGKDCEGYECVEEWHFSVAGYLFTMRVLGGHVLRLMCRWNSVSGIKGESAFIELRNDHESWTKRFNKPMHFGGVESEVL
jgi:hypothetical protein